ncbi:serine/threonine-protein kinase SMG1 isoform X1 [Neodiprion virginianus]|uniref:serine/threonine-protein kinase SMG1 isoform X1 n=1 Tax=Neodiprion virginianus TaxID=2961670 RepID=UPI001EE73E0C|nr:serine/threonine-protein kinase SMG1 isoform X1 [Neodiprion virginianus]XP_046606358.1 serine/threonine-protein kinase SMG1 isoform X1 [Neodiprion virginianus]XP_046606359.1 serine/threonine-protein kinase SMG1 isoform X1 [Neodiprion virginianus]
MNSCGNANASTKLRGAKVTTELREEHVGNSDSNNEEKGDGDGDNNTLPGYSAGDSINQRQALFICQRNSTLGYSSDRAITRFKSRTSSGARNEYRMARGGSTGERGRGGSRGRAFKKTPSDRESNSVAGYHPVSRSKFQEPLKNQDNSPNKYYDDKRGNEDSRISKLLRRLCREDDYDNFMGLCKQLREVMVAPENQRYVRRSMDLICESLLDTLHSGPGLEAKQQAARCLGRVGYVVDQDFKRYMEWVFNKYSLERNDDVKCLLIKSFVETFKLDAQAPKLKEFSVPMMSELQSTLENVDRPDLLTATVDAILLLTESYPETFSNHFRDTVDILVGWHIDSTQQKQVVAYASRSLQKLRNFWIGDLEFSLTLLGQFLEDMESYDEELTLPGSGTSSPGGDVSPSPRECILRITSLISVFNTVTKSISDHLNPNFTPSVQWSFLTDSLSKMLRTVVKAVELDDGNEAWVNNLGLTRENTESLTRSMRSMNLSQKNIEILLRNLGRDDINEESLVKMIKSLNVGKRNDRKNSKISSEKEILSMEKEQSLINLLKSTDLKGKKIQDLSVEKEELIVIANECAFLLLGYLQSRVTKNHDLLYKFIDLQLEKVNTFWDDTIVSTLNIIGKVIKEVSANLPLELVHKLLGQTSVLLQLRFRNSIPIQNASLGVYRSLLSLKNIPLLQEAYRYILADLETAYKLIVGNANDLVVENPLFDVKYKRKDSELVVIFLLRALSDIANASNSIIGMWALKPSILELLAIRLRPYDDALAMGSPLLQYTVLYLLYAHCSRYNHFVSSSVLISGTNTNRPKDIFPGTLDVPTTSPTSGHLSIILHLIAKTFKSTTSNKVLLLLANWTQEIFIQAENYIGILNKTEECYNILTSLICCGYTTNHDISLAVGKNFEVLTSVKNIFWPEQIYLDLIDLAILHLTSHNPNVHRKYAQLLMNLPLDIVIPKLNRACLVSETKKSQTINRYTVKSLVLSQRLHMRGNSNGEMQAQHFRTFMAYLLQEYHLDATALSEVFTLCWPSVHENEAIEKIYEMALANRSFLLFWGGFEAAQHCVGNKLRTPLGKPQETFTTIEGALKTLAREISCHTEVTRKDERGLEYSLHEHNRVRLLIEFLEHLERVIHNASEGCALALLPLSKPVRTFFHTNKSTCREWLNRIRLALCVVSLHAGMAANVLRNGQRLMEDISNSENAQGTEFERAVLCTTKAMVKLGEAEALQGLYVYTKDKEKKFTWLKAATDQAASRYEAAIDGYKNILVEQSCWWSSQSDNETTNTAPKIDRDVQVAAFCFEQLTKCYRAVSDWSELEAWKVQESEVLKNPANAVLDKQIFENVVPQQARSLHKFEENENILIEELSDWTLLDKEAKTNWSCTKTIIECTNTLTNIAIRIQNDVFEDHHNEDIENCRKVAEKTVSESLRSLPAEYLSDALMVQYSAAGLTALISGKNVNAFELYRADKINYLDSNILTQVLWWSDYFARAGRTCCTELASLRLNVVRNARKECNFNLAKREIVKYFKGDYEFLDVNGKINVTFDDLTTNILNGPIHVKWSKNNVRAFKEVAKILFSMESGENAIRICSGTALGISQAIVNGEQCVGLREMGTKLLLTLGKWIQQDDTKINSNTQLEELLKFEAVHNDGLMDNLFGETKDLIPISDMIVGKLAQLGVNQCPDLPKAWCKFAAWCYKWGRKIVDNSNSGQLVDTDRANIRSLLPLGTTDVDVNMIFSILSQNKTIPEDEGDIDTSDVNTSEMIENQLRNVAVLSNVSLEHLGKLVEIWRQAQRRVYSYYELSANAYFKYLELASCEPNGCALITATLRILRLVVKHALELQGVLESGLSSTPTCPWKEIIPQLFSRLSHPEAYVRTRVAELLCRVAEHSPHLITFPAVVGAVSGDRYETTIAPTDPLTAEMESATTAMNAATSSLTELDFIEDERYGSNDEGQNILNSCFMPMVDCLSKKIPDTINQVQVLVKELRRITLLWDELWLATLVQHHAEITRRFAQLEIEIRKVRENASLPTDEKEQLIAEKHRIILKPIIFVLENLLAITSVPPETPHERYFQNKFGEHIDEVMKKLMNPKNPGKPQDAGLSLKQLQAKFTQKAHKRGAYSLKMTDISPVLANLKDTGIPMPGVLSVDNKVVTIKSVDINVQILPTKTKPKKLIFHGSDGHVYTYLFKGLEDLHLDERIMQFLGIANTMMSKNNDTKRIYRARHYSVIPLGPRSGLIQWVDGVTPLFALYKRWQQRDSVISGKGAAGAVMRPSELFYNKLAPLLKERGVALDNRKEWPLPVLKQVLAELMAETPKDLLAKEIWCNSINPGSWWQATKNYSYSVAVMSIIGYIIGLGDRHLDNVLVDLNTGEVVHIDYNVCFEKGKTLRVPEKVPFRMTPNIKTALGVTGVEGIFRLACEHTLRVMRRGRETLLTLLEAFVYDPLVDWRAGAETSIASYGACQARARCTGIGRKQLEKEMTTAMFTVRAAEMRAEWTANRDELVAVFPLLRRHLTHWIETTAASRECQDLLQDRHQELALVKEAQAMGRTHALYSVVKRYAAFKRARDARDRAKSGLVEKIEECGKHINMHNIALSAVRGPQLGQWLAEVGVPTTPEDHLVFDLVKEFLQNAGQSQMIIHCEQSENELAQLATQQSLLIRNCLDLLSQYSAICSLYPISIMSRHRSVAYHAWSNTLLSTRSVEVCHEVMSQFEASFAPITANNPQVQHIVTFSYQLQSVLSNANERFKKACERMVVEELPGVLGIVEKAYTDSKLQVGAFLRREKGADKALECVNITALCALNKRYLMMEGAAKCAGDCLVDLTSREGDWFLDEMCLMSSLVAELVTLIPDSHKSNNDPKIPLILKCLQSADSIYRGLQELNYNFHTIILPEAMKTVVTEEPTVMVMVSEIEDVVSTSLPTAEILAQLEMHLRFTVMEMESPHAGIRDLVASIRQRFDTLLSRPAELRDPNQEESLTPGQMLLMGFNGLFEKLQMEGNALVATLSTLNIPTSWKKIDQIREAKEMASPIFNDAARQVIEDIFLIKRLQTIREFFAMCRDTGAAFKGGPANVFDDERLNKPVRTFTADYVSRQLLGVTTQTLAIALCYLLQRMGLNVTTEIEQRDIGAESKVSLEELCRKIVDLSLKRGLFTGSVLAQASASSSSLESSWRKKQSVRLARQAVDVARASVQRIQLHLTAHHWLHEDSIIVGSTINPMGPLNRPTFMLDMRKTAAALSNLQSRVCEAREQQQNLVSSAGQRLKWAAGANPALGEVMAAFDNAVATSWDKLTRQHNLAAVVVNTSNSILHYEALRTRTSESVSNDSNFMTLIKNWEKSCVLTANLTTGVTPMEESLIELLHLDGNVDASWLRQAEKLISEVIVETQKKLQEKQELLYAAHDSLREQVLRLQSVIGQHHRLMMDVRGLLKTMAKQENIPGLRDYLMSYRSFTERISSAVKDLESDGLDPLNAFSIREELEQLEVQTPSLYDELLNFANSTKLTDKEVPFNKKAKLVRQDSVCFSPRKGVPLARDPTTGKAVQERNAYALNVWRRVRMKLEGRDANPSRRYTPAEQVEYVIREAQSSENLALLYEGWTPWV